jgi:hypothetical protein
MNRREFLAATAPLPVVTALGAEPPKGTDRPFRHRGYYTIGTRYPTAGLAVWKHALDCMHADGCNLLIHWAAGGFKSKKFPETWAHNKDHENVKADFTREMIDYAHGRGIRVLLGFTPFGYDGVNRYTATRPELVATGRDGKPAGEFGIFCWGRSLCPAQSKSRTFMLDYVREMLFDFYPNADGLFVESSDYSTCRCRTCGAGDGAGHFEQEYEFVKTISAEVWKHNDRATVVVYPHYFSGDAVGHLDGKVRAAGRPFEDRYTLFFTPHSTAPNAGLLKKAKDALWWDEALIFGTPQKVKEGARLARERGFSGYTPTLEAYSFVATRNEGEPWTEGRRQVPFGLGWVPFDKSPYNELPIRVARAAFREFTKNPDLPFDDFKTMLGKEVFGDKSTERHVADLLLLQQYVRHERSWALPSPVLEPLRVRHYAASGKLTDDRKADLRKAVENVRAMADRYRGGAGGEAELAAAARWIADQWTGDNAKLLGLEGGK